MLCKRYLKPSVLALELLFKPRAVTIATTSRVYDSEFVDSRFHAPPVEYNEREHVPRDDDFTNAYAHIRHRKTPDPKQFRTTIEELQESALRPELEPEGERYVNRLIISLKGGCYATLRSFIMYADFAAKCLDIETSVEPDKLVTGVYTVNRSPHVHGKHMDRFKRDIWCRKVILHEISGTTADVYLSYVQRNIPQGMTMAVTEERLVELDREFLETYYSETNAKLLDDLGTEDLALARNLTSTEA